MKLSLYKGVSPLGEGGFVQVPFFPRIFVYCFACLRLKLILTCSLAILIKTHSAYKTETFLNITSHGFTFWLKVFQLEISECVGSVISSLHEFLIDESVELTSSVDCYDIRSHKSKVSELKQNNNLHLLHFALSIQFYDEGVITFFILYL